MRAALRAALLGMLLGAQVARAQIKVMTPKYLVEKFRDTRGKIPGSTATFGAPFYGDRVLGRLVYGPSLLNKTHCTADDYNLPDPQNRTSSGGYNKAKLITIAVVRRGSCSFTTKVNVAYEKGAHAVIIVDKAESNLKRKDISQIIVADDGYGGSIHIPSILIAKEDGEPLISAASRSSMVVVELAWDIPTDTVVTMDLWMSSASHESNIFLKEFASKRRKLNQVMSFNPHYAVMSMDGGDAGVYNGLCYDDSGKYCAEDPDGAGDVTGKDVLEEDVRQLCIHENTKAVRSNPDDITNSAHVVEYAAKYWDYIEKYLDSCPLEGTGDKRFGLACSTNVMKSVGIDPPLIANCVASSTEEKLKLERRNQAWSPRALRINGWRYSGMLTADLVSRAVCSGFIHQPDECTSLFKPRDVFQPYVIHPDSGGVSFGTMLLWLSLTILLGFGCMLLYKRYLKADMRTTLREEVMLEVQAQMGQYGRLASGA